MTLVARAQVWVHAECPVRFEVLTEVTRGSRFIRNVSARPHGVTSQKGILHQIPSVQLLLRGVAIFVNTIDTVESSRHEMGGLYSWRYSGPKSEAMQCPSLQCADLFSRTSVCLHVFAFKLVLLSPASLNQLNNSMAQNYIKALFYRATDASLPVGLLNLQIFDAQWKIWVYVTCVSASRRKTIPAPSLTVVSKNLVLNAIHWTNTCGPKLTAEWNTVAANAALPADTRTGLSEEWRRVSS
jgi:hypothetical protein